MSSVKANNSENARLRLGEEEVLAQMHNLTAAGQETTAGTLSWMLYELARHPDVQARIRREVRAARAEVLARGDEDFSMEDLNGMELTVAAIKVRCALRRVMGGTLMSACRRPCATTRPRSTSGA